MNGRSLSNPTAQALSHVQRIPRCERAQREIEIHRMGSFQTFAATGANGC